MGYEDLFTLRTELTMAISRIAAQLDTARAKADESGEPVNRFWYNRAKVAQRFKNQFIQLTEREMGKQRRAEKDQRTATFYEQFMTEARSILDADTFAKITDTAKAGMPAVAAPVVPSVPVALLAAAPVEGSVGALVPA